MLFGGTFKEKILKNESGLFWYWLMSVSVWGQLLLNITDCRAKFLGKIYLHLICKRICEREEGIMQTVENLQ